MPFQHIYGIDLGTSTVKIYDRKTDSILQEKNMIAMRGEDTVFAVGDEAYEMFGRTPEDIQVISPVSSGRISNVLMTEAVLHTLLRRCATKPGAAPRLYFSVPVDMTEIERRVYSTITKKGQLRRSSVYLVEKPIADAMALAIPIHHTRGSMIINIGAENTELSILAEEHIIFSRSLPYGGKLFNEAITAGVRRKNHFAVSRRTARQLKQSLADLGTERREGMQVMGIDTETGLPRDGVVSSYTVTRAVRGQMKLLAEEIRRFLDRTPPQIRENIRSEGVFLNGGSARIPGIDRFLADILDVPVNISGLYEMSTIEGLRELINHPELHHWAAVPGRRKS